MFAVCAATRPRRGPQCGSGAVAMATGGGGAVSMATGAAESAAAAPAAAMRGQGSPNSGPPSQVSPRGSGSSCLISAEVLAENGAAIFLSVVARLVRKFSLNLLAI